MEKNLKQSKYLSYPIPNSFENISTALKPNNLKNKEIFLNNFLQETYNQKKSKAKTSLLYEKMIDSKKTNMVREKLLKKSDIPLSSYYKKKHKNKIDIQDSNVQSHQFINPFIGRNNSNKSSEITSNENQLSLLINTRNIETKNEKSFFNNLDDKKIKRHKTVYIKKYFSVDRNMKTNNYKYKNISKDDKDKYYHSTSKNDQDYYSSSTTRKHDKNISNKNNTNNINSNVNIFNFGMQYGNAPHYFIRNSKMFDPYFNNYFPYSHSKLDYNLRNYNKEVKDQVILIQSVYRGCVIRFHFNNLLKTYKGIEFLDLFFKNKFWNNFKQNLLLYKIHKEFDSKLSISSISGFSALANYNNNKISNLKNCNQNYLKESKEAFFILSKNNIKNDSCEEKYLASFEKNNMIENNKGKKLIWNKKMANKNNSILSNIINQKLFSKDIKKLKMDKKETPIISEKQKFLKILVTKKIEKSRLSLLKFFLRFYYNGILCNEEKNKTTKINNININVKQLKLEKLKKIIDNRNAYQFEILFKFFSRFKFKGILNYIQTNQYLIINGGRLKNIEEDSFFIYEFNKCKNKENNNTFGLDRNLKSYLLNIVKLRIILYDKKHTKNEIIKKYFHKFRMAGIKNYMQLELKKKLMIKLLILKSNVEIFSPKKENKDEIENKKYNKLGKLILKYSNCNLNTCKNIFDRWNLRTKIFSMITKDKEKKKKRRIKKRHNKKLAANINNINNENNIQQMTDSNSTSKNNNNFLYNSNYKINNKDNKNKINKLKYDVGHPDSIIYIDNIKITDYFKITNFINKLNGIITKKFYFFKYIVNKTKKQNEKESKNCINNEVDFFMDDSSESDN